MVDAEEAATVAVAVAPVVATPCPSALLATQVRKDSALQTDLLPGGGGSSGGYGSYGPPPPPKY